MHFEQKFIAIEIIIDNIDKAPDENNIINTIENEKRKLNI